MKKIIVCLKADFRRSLSDRSRVLLRILSWKYEHTQTHTMTEREEGTREEAR